MGQWLLTEGIATLRGILLPHSGSRSAHAVPQAMATFLMIGVTMTLAIMTAMTRMVIAEAKSGFNKPPFTMVTTQGHLLLVDDPRKLVARPRARHRRCQNVMNPGNLMHG